MSAVNMMNIFSRSVCKCSRPKESRILLACEDQNKKEYGFLDGCLNQWSMVDVPTDIIRLIFLYFYEPCHIVTNEAASFVFNQKDRTFSNDVTGHNTYFKLTKPLYSGIAVFEIECVVGDKCAISIGIMTNLDAIEKEVWLFDGKQCGESIQLHLTTTRAQVDGVRNALYHYRQGKEILKEVVSDVQPTEFEAGQRVKLICDFNRLEVAFFVDSVQAGTAMKIRQDTVYYAAFAYIMSPTAKYKLCKTSPFM